MWLWIFFHADVTDDNEEVFHDGERETSRSSREWKSSKKASANDHLNLKGQFKRLSSAKEQLNLKEQFQKIVMTFLKVFFYKFCLLNLQILAEILSALTVGNF